MQKALALAQKGAKSTLPNPMVGAVIVKNNRIIGQGYHTAYGKPHAEIEALKACKISPKDATLYVTLEPCCHFGKTPPCTKAIIESGIKEVVISAFDPSKKVNGKGIKELKKAGIKVRVGMLKKEAEELNRIFFTFHTKKRPFVTIKAAVSLDFCIAKSRTERTFLTGKKEEKYTHTLRATHEAILVGAGTVLADNPHLGVRAVEGKDPLRVIMAGPRKLPKNLKIFRDKNVLVLKNKTPKQALTILYKMGITSVLVEGGQKIFTSFLQANLVDEIIFFVANIELGKDAVGFVENGLFKP